VSIEFFDELPDRRGTVNDFDIALVAVHERPGMWGLVTTQTGKSLQNVSNMWRQGVTRRCRDCTVAARTCDDGIQVFVRHNGAA
jgi:hypothetical protein